MTRKLYYEDAYLKEAKAKVVEIKENALLLDQTIFYPTGGGQPHDRGTISGVQVLDVYKDEDGNVWHVVEDVSKFDIGDEVELRIDWDYRYKLMRIHTSMHLLDHVLSEVLGRENWKIVGSGMNVEKGRYDVEYPENINKFKEQIIELFNKYVDEGGEVKIWWEGEKRLTQIRDFEVLPCGGTHVKDIKEIGHIKKLKRSSIGKGKQRLEIWLE
ncbi:alanyl-tRNA editing protein AlaX [Palaeococcus pacificus DY20341]|uniref:Alanyl-tRNA editing protein AlaX n=1 Tax=Palaeococcus pacificus DY20341 TaxID=1343739 RepID=A0A075LSP7_9EURY|nr:alanyl-tRNA editing protein [Palaeococcus pacificus]AIF69780.1 alanyl-tRNA editing protein AlaX [Palaeococcus pacificus DY20341]